MISVLTCPWRRDYLLPTLAALDREGASADPDRFLFVDDNLATCNMPPTPGWQQVEVFPGIRKIKQLRGKVGPRLAMTWILTFAQSQVRRTHGQALYYFEDDILPCRDAVLAMFKHEVPPDCGFTSFCDIQRLGSDDHLTKHRGYQDLTDRKDFGHWGNQALKIPRRSLDYASTLNTNLDRFRDHDLRGKSDVALGNIFCAPPSPTPLYARTPSIFQHTGELSSFRRYHHLVWNSPGRTVAGFDVNRDALSLNL